MAENNTLRYVAFGITNHCSHNCSFCYETAKLKPEDRRHGDLETLKQICDELHTTGVKFVELVGGDPVDYPEIEPLTEYLHHLGISIGILSNTHRTWQKYAPYVSTLEWTVHGPESYHNALTKPESYAEVVNRLKHFAERKRADQQIGLTINFTPIMAQKLYEVVRDLAEELPIDYVQLQRVGPFGGAANGSYSLKLEEVISIYRQIQHIDSELGIRIEVVDSYPICILPDDLRHYTAHCDWGFGTAYVDMDGNLSRCAVNQIPLGNILNPQTPLTWLWENHPSLIKFREKQYLPQRCQKCDLLEECGGGCPSSCGGCELSADSLIISAR